MTTTAETFRHLHAGPGLLLLANCWDAGSARLIESLGARAMATTSAGVAWSHGFPDGNALPTDRLLATIRAITRVIAIPLSVDLEGGYSDDPLDVAELVARVLGEGAVGVNIEDGRSPPELLAAKIEQLKRVAAHAHVDLFVNARTDVYLQGLVDAPQRVAETLRRAKRYRDAGADGLFVPLVTAPAEIQAIAADSGMPLNLLATRGVPPASELVGLGVRRLSAGSAIASAVGGHSAALASAFLREGRSEALYEKGIPYPEMNALFAR